MAHGLAHTGSGGLQIGLPWDGPLSPWAGWAMAQPAHSPYGLWAVWAMGCMGYGLYGLCMDQPMYCDGPAHGLAWGIPIPYPRS